MSDRQAPKRHASKAISAEVIEELTYRWYLRRLDPPMTPEESARTITHCQLRNGKTLAQDEAHRRKCSRVFQSLTRDFLHVSVDLRLVAP